MNDTQAARQSKGMKNVRSRSVKGSSLLIAAVAIAAVYYYTVKNRDPWIKYGITHKITFGESNSLNFVDLEWIPNGTRVAGLKIRGDMLYVTYRQTGNDKVPEMVVRSEMYRDEFAVVRLKNPDVGKPGFEISSQNGVTIEYYEE